MNDSNKDMAKFLFQAGSLVLTVGLSVLGMDKTNKEAKQAGRDAPLDTLKKWFS